MTNHIYLDNSATTKVRPEVVEAMLPYIDGLWGNPSSIHHFGRKSHEAVDAARAQVAQFLNCQPSEILFTPCSTYSNNTAILGRARFAEANGQGRHLITSLVEHPSVMGPAKYLEGLGWKVTYLPVDRQGFVSVDDLKQSITNDTSIISIIWANNEIGTVEPIEDLAQVAKEKSIYFHTDAVQVAGKLPIDLGQLPVSTLALSGHKFYAPKGVGILFVRQGVNLMPIVFGGGQEGGLFPGTENLPYIVGIGKAAELCAKELPQSTDHLRKLQAIMTKKILSVDGVKVTGPVDPDKRLPGHLSVVVPGAQGDALVLRSDLKGVCVSSGSACHSGVIEPSQILKAICLPRHEALGAVRISASAFTSVEELEKSADILADVFRSLIQQPATSTK